MYIHKAIEMYLDDLAARKSAPGGGSAAALGAAIGASLMSMAANYTIGNPKYKEVEPEVSAILKKSEAARRGLQKLIDADVEAYNKLSKAMKERKGDAAGMDEAYKEAAAPPFEVCKIAADCLKLCAELADFGNKNLITDTAIAAIMLEGAFLSARFNVYINLKYIKDTEYIAKVHGVLSPLEESIPKLKEEIIEKCEQRF